jgi:hypothetical protein
MSATAVLLALLVVGGVAVLVVLAARGRGSRGRSPGPVTLPLPRGPHHLHYCTRCDQQWEHAGASHECTRSWAAPCPACAAPASPAR